MSAPTTPWQSPVRRDAFDVVTAAGARALGLAPHRPAVGSSADLIAVAAEGVPEAGVARPRPTLVLAGGAVVADDSPPRSTAGMGSLSGVRRIGVQTNRIRSSRSIV